MRRVLIITPHFPPDTSAASHRVRLIAPYLYGNGWRPTILTVTPATYEGRLDDELNELVADDLEIVRCAGWPAPLTRLIGIGDLGLRSVFPLYRAACRLLVRGDLDMLFITI